MCSGTPSPHCGRGSRPLRDRTCRHDRTSIPRQPTGTAANSGFVAGGPLEPGYHLLVETAGSDHSLIAEKSTETAPRGCVVLVRLSHEMREMWPMIPSADAFRQAHGTRTSVLLRTDSRRTAKTGA